MKTILHEHLFLLETMRRPFFLLAALSVVFFPASVRAQTINTAGRQGHLVLKIIAPSLNLIQREQVFQRLSARFSDFGVPTAAYTTDEEHDALLLIVINPTRSSSGISPSNTSARLNRLITYSTDYLATPFNSTTNPSALYDISLSFKSTNRGAHFISRAESHDFARYNSMTVSSASGLEWTTMLAGVNGADYIIADVIVNAFHQQMQAMMRAAEVNEEK